MHGSGTRSNPSVYPLLPSLLIPCGPILHLPSLVFVPWCPGAPVPWCPGACLIMPACLHACLCRGGHGLFGSVRKAYDHKLKIPVALKVVRLLWPHHLFCSCFPDRRLCPSALTALNPHHYQIPVADNGHEQTFGGKSDPVHSQKVCLLLTPQKALCSRRPKVPANLLGLLAERRGCS